MWTPKLKYVSISLSSVNMYIIGIIGVKKRTHIYVVSDYTNSDYISMRPK